MNLMVKNYCEKDLTSLRDFVDQKLRPGAARRDAEENFAWEIYREMFQKGWLHSYIPKEFGGQAWPMSDLIFFARELAQGSAGVFTTVLACVATTSVIQYFASPELQKKIFSDYSEDSPLFAFAMTEDNAGFDVARIRSEAIKTDKGFVLNGRKNFISNASHARHYCLFAQTKDVAGRELGISAFYVPAGTPGFRAGEKVHKMGHREANTAELLFEGVEIPASHLIGEVGQGLMILGKGLIRSKSLIAAAACGMARRALDVAVAHLQTRGSLERSLLARPTLQHQLVEMEVKLQAAWLLVAQAASLFDAGSWSRTEANFAKYFATDAAVGIVNECVELMGAQAICAEHELSRMYRDIKIMEIYEGSSQILSTLISKDLFEGGRPTASRAAKRAA